MPCRKFGSENFFGISKSSDIGRSLENVLGKFFENLAHGSYLTSGVGRLLHLPSAEGVSFRPNVHPRM